MNEVTFCVGSTLVALIFPAGATIVSVDYDRLACVAAMRPQCDAAGEPNPNPES